jgi:integrase
MSKLRLRFVQAWVDEDGRPHHYFRRRGFKRRPLPGMVGSPEFMREYTAAMGEAPRPIGADTRSRPGTIAAAVAAYLDSTLYFGSRPKGTQAQQRSVLNRFREKYGQERLAGMPPSFIAAVLSTLKPFAARNWLTALRAFCQFAVAQGLLKADPTQGVKLPKAKSDGHHPWTDEEIAQYEARHRIGSEARLALALGLYTVQRRGDVLRMGRQHIRDGVLHLKQQKTHAELDLPVRTELAAILAATPTGHLAFLVSERNAPYHESTFSKHFRAWCREAGLPARCTFHGLRKAGCRILAHADCTAFEVQAWSGHKTLKEIERYTGSVEQDRLAKSALAKIMAARTNHFKSVKVDEAQVSNPLKQLKKKATL